MARVFSDFERAMIKTKAAFMCRPNSTFLSTVCFHLQMVIDDSHPTAATNGLKMWINPDFFMSLTEGGRLTLLAHETGHVVFQHMSRMTSKDLKKFNIAGDHVINLDLLNSKYEAIPGWYADPIYAGLSTEEVYRLLPDDAEDGGDLNLLDLVDPTVPGEDKSDGNGGIVPGDLPMAPKKLKEHLDDILVKAVTASKMKGDTLESVPGAVQVYLRKLLKPKLPLAALLRPFFREVAKTDYSWKRPNKRYMPMYLPALQGDSLSHIVFAYDMSCSVSDTDTLRYASEMAGVLRHMKPSKMTLLQFDTEIISVDIIKTVRELEKMELKGRGGTDIGPVMAWAKKHKPQAIVIFTDGEFWTQWENPDVPVLWLIHGSNKEQFTCPFGRTVRFDV